MGKTNNRELRINVVDYRSTKIKCDVWPSGHDIHLLPVQLYFMINSYQEN